jgi:hypothetical protein
MATRGSGLTATGLALTLTAVGAGVSSSGGFALLVSFVGVLAGASLIFVGVRMDDGPAPAGRPGVLAAGVHCLRRNLGLTGLLLASSAVSAMPVERRRPRCSASARLLCCSSGYHS